MIRAPAKHECSDCGKKNAVGKARLCPTCCRKHAKASKRKAHDRAIEVKYGITGDEYDMLYAAQGGKCAICLTATGKARMLAVDHDHKTNIKRGLLCGSCNHRLLGGAHESIEMLQRAIDYLRNPPAPALLQEYRNESAHS